VPLEQEIQKVADALEAHGYQSDLAEDDLLYVLHSESGKRLTLSSSAPGVVAIGFEDGTEETVDAKLSYDELVQEFSLFL
jgi:hypothetical protein